MNVDKPSWIMHQNSLQKAPPLGLVRGESVQGHLSILPSCGASCRFW